MRLSGAEGKVHGKPHHAEMGNPLRRDDEHLGAVVHRHAGQVDKDGIRQSDIEGRRGLLVLPCEVGDTAPGASRSS